MDIRQINTRDYELTLINGAERLIVTVNPVLSGAEYEKARADFEKEWDQYQRLLKAREQRLQAIQDSLETGFGLQRQQIEKAFQARLDRLQGEHALNGADLIARQKIINRFTANSFGIWNCDRPVPPEEVVVKGTLETPAGTALKNQVAYLVDKNRNTVTRFFVDTPTEFRFNANSQNLMWMITEENKIAILRPEKFKNVKPGSKNVSFVLEVVDREIRHETDVREILYF